MFFHGFSRFLLSGSVSARILLSGAGNLNCRQFVDSSKAILALNPCFHLKSVIAIVYAIRQE
jgi:hypothetical protein